MSEILIVGGDIFEKRNSSIVKKISQNLTGPVITFNGCLPNDLNLNNDLIIWMPDIHNMVKKQYPRKKQGSVLICSKVMREGYTHVDSISRIFKMGANAVIEIYIPTLRGPYEFELRDALNHCWCERTTDIKELVRNIYKLYYWTKDSIRKSLLKGNLEVGELESNSEVERFIKINEELSYKVAADCGNRFFGNYSTRCTRLFPNVRLNKDWYLFSGRNTPKNNITMDDMVVCTHSHYFGDKKPSVDTPIQLAIYEEFPDLQFMIHGHAYIKDAKTTKKYYPCGDMREVSEVLEQIENDVRIINLKNHGFLLVGETVDEIISHANTNSFHPTW